LAYCLVAAMVPMLMLLQPRGHLGGCFLYVALAGAAIGLVVSDRLVAGDSAIRYPAFTGWQASNGQNLIPMLFITIACGACSGFHSLIASGTTSKQLRRETDARPIRGRHGRLIGRWCRKEMQRGERTSGQQQDSAQHDHRSRSSGRDTSKRPSHDGRRHDVG
jgi:hypothetical protein